MSTAAGHAASPPTILVVDDDRGLLRLMERSLQREGFLTATAASFQEAVDWLEDHRPTLMLLDLKLGEIGGKDLVDHLLVNGRPVPFVIITGQGDERVAVAMMKRGALDYLVKDVNFVEFLPEVVRRTLGQLERDQKLAAAEEALRQSQANLAKAQQIAHLGSYELDLISGADSYRSEEICRILGLDPSQEEPGRGDPLELRVHPEDQASYRQALHQAIREARLAKLEYRILRPDGTVRHVQSLVEPVRNAKGQITKLVGTLLDITERKLGELRQNVQHTVTRALAESATLSEAAPRILQAVCDTLDWDMGEFWHLDASGRTLYHVETQMRSRPATPWVEEAGRTGIQLAAGEGLAGQAWEAGKPVWIADLAEHCRSSYAGVVPQGMRCAVAFPVLLGSETLGAVVLFSRDPRGRDEDLVQLLALLGSQIGQFIERKRLEQEILQISELEQRRIGSDLHDGLCQQLAATALMGEILEQRLARRSKADAARVAEISRQVREAITQTRSLARGLSPVVVESEGLMSALVELADYSERMFRIHCEFECSPPVPVHDHVAATHLYRVAQEAVSNAVRHGKAKRVIISLERVDERIVLRIVDDGVGLPEDLSHAKGMGLRIMQYRAAIIRGRLSVSREPAGGTAVVCSIPNESQMKSTSP